jgi:uncharacterized membrane protein
MTMALMLDVLKGRWFSVVGISVTGAWVNNLVQVVIAFLLFVRHPDIFLILPVFGLFGLATGVVNGIAVYYLDRYAAASLSLKRRFSFSHEPQGAR